MFFLFFPPTPNDDDDLFCFSSGSHRPRQSAPTLVHALSKSPRSSPAEIALPPRPPPEKLARAQRSRVPLRLLTCHGAVGETIGAVHDAAWRARPPRQQQQYTLRGHGAPPAPHPPHPSPLRSLRAFSSLRFNPEVLRAHALPAILYAAGFARHKKDDDVASVQKRVSLPPR